MQSLPLRLLLVVAALLGLVLRTGPARAAATAWQGDTHAAARLITAVEATGSGGEIDAGLQIRLAPGWHAYWRDPGAAGIPPSIEWVGSQNVKSATIAWPAPRRFVLDGLQTYGYEHGVVLPISVALVHPGQAVTLRADVHYSACKNVCMPYHASFVLHLPPGLAAPGPEAPLIAAARAKVPGSLSAAGLHLVGAMVAHGKQGPVLAVRLASAGASFRAPDMFVEGVPNDSPGRPKVGLANGGEMATLRLSIQHAAFASVAGAKLRLTVVDGARAATFGATPEAGTLPPIAGDDLSLAIIGVALLGGLVLNLMPCVLPVLSLKLLALIGYAGAERRHARLGLLATASGVIVSFLMLAGALIGLKAVGAAIGWGIQFQQPWFLAAMAVVTTLFAASLWDWLPLALPGGMASAIGGVRGCGRLSSAFLVGVFATLLAASCTAPFVGTAVGFALARGPLDIALIFAALGLGMAAPFIAIAAWPGLIAWLPRPGRWMAWLRWVLGFALLGTAAWLLSVLTSVAGLRPTIGASVAIAALLAVLAGRQIWHSRLRMRVLAGAVAVPLAIVAILIPSLSGEAASQPITVLAGPWRPFDQAAIHRLVGQGRVVFVDVTAAWCLVCKANELTVLDRAPVAARLRAPGVVAMRADWTRPSPSVTAYLQSFSRYGVPLDVVYGPGAPAGTALPELLTPGVVMDAFRKAAATRTPALVAQQ